MITHLASLALALITQVATLADDATLEHWRESLALDMPGEVLGDKTVVERTMDGPATVPAWREHFGYSQDGRAVALIARAVLLGVKDGANEAQLVLATARPTGDTAVYVELERVHLAIENDDLDGALALLLAKPDATEPRWARLPQSWYETGRAFVRAGDSKRAAPFLRRFIELAPHDRDAPAAFHMLAREAIERGDGAMARQCVDRAEQLARWHGYWRARTIQVREHPNEPLPRLGLAQLWLQAADLDRAKSVLRDLLKLAPDYAPAWFHMGEAERLGGNLKAANEDYAKTLELDPEHLLARNNRANLALKDERLADARADFEHIVDGPHATEPHALGAHLQLARVLDRLGESDAATKRYARYVELGGKEPRKP